LDPFDLDIALAKDNPLNWWKYIDTAPEPAVLPKIAFHLYSICPNSASSEREFSTLGWLFHKRRLNLSLEKLESMSKMILYWKSNSKTELGFYGINQKNNTRLSDEQINIYIAEAFAEMDEEEYSDEQISTPRVTTDGEVIPEDNCRVIIESVWIDELVDLSHRLITNEIGDIPSDMFDSDENIGDDENNDDRSGPIRVGEGDYNYNINDLLGGNDDVDDEV
jgi:hypothetical protein